MHQISNRTAECLTLLEDCRITCMSMTFLHCLEMGGEHARPQHLRLMMDCASTCLFTADLLARKSQIHNRACALCADVCETCAADCEKLGGMEQSVAACRAAASACRELAKLDHLEVLTMASQIPPSA